ncbi:MAG TPA: hypothetical protein VGL86_32660 [Polyangia bacterium]|jgi:hypothetical protein
MKRIVMYALLALGIGIPTVAMAAELAAAASHCPIPGCHCNHQ